jgi:glycosyltransferase involved in cell wall biosynthesis
MKILWLEPEPPVAPFTGGRERARRLLDYLSPRHAIHLLTYAAPEDEPKLAALRSQLAGVTTVPYSPRPDKPCSSMQQAVTTALGHFRPDSFHVHGLDLWPYAPPAARRVLDLYDIPSLLHARLLAAAHHGRLLSGWRERRKPASWRRREIAALAEAAAVIVVSPTDRAALLAGVDGTIAPVIVVPNGVTLSDWPPAVVLPEPATILFPGALNWRPNIDAVHVLVREVLPVVQKQVPGVNVVIAGRQPARSVCRLAETNTAVTLIPNPPDMHPIFAQAAVTAIPLRAASGTRLKILQALAVGRPVVSTPLGAEGLGLENGRHLIIAELVTPFAAALSGLLADPARQRLLIKAGQAVVAQFDWNRHLPALAAVYEDVL